MATLVIASKKKPSMPPPGASSGKKPGLTVAIGVGPKMPPPGASQMAQAAADGDPDDSMPASGAGKISADKAISVKANEHCKDCQNYAPESGECQKVDGYWEPEDACVREFKPIAGNQDPDNDGDVDDGGAGDTDQDSGSNGT